MGCLGCPLRSDNGVGEYLKYPKLLRQVIKSVQIYLDTHPQTKAFEMYDGNACNLVFSRLFCSGSEKYKILSTGGLFHETEIDTKQYLEDYFGIEL